MSSNPNPYVTTTNCAWNDYGIYQGSGYNRYVFTTTGTNACNLTISGYSPLVYYYIVGGGATGKWNGESVTPANNALGPGSGGSANINSIIVPSGSYNITVGAEVRTTLNGSGTKNGNPSTFNNITALGGTNVAAIFQKGGAGGTSVKDILNNYYYYGSGGGHAGYYSSSGGGGGVDMNGSYTGTDGRSSSPQNGGKGGGPNGGAGGLGGNTGVDSTGQDATGPGGGGGGGGYFGFGTSGGNGGFGGGGGGGVNGSINFGNGGNGGFGNATYNGNPYGIIGGGAGGGAGGSKNTGGQGDGGRGSQGFVVIIVQDPPPRIPATITVSAADFYKVFQDLSFSLGATTTNSQTAIQYTSGNTFVATIGSSNNIIINNVGTTKIQLYQPQTIGYLEVFASANISVSQLQSTLNYTTPSNVKYKDISFNLRANTNVNSATIRYTTSNPLIANVTSTGNVIVGNAGTANINLTILGTNNYSTISANILITVNPIQANLNYPAISNITKKYKDATFPLNANTTNTDNTTILYSTDNSIVANINSFGNITVGNVGTANIKLIGSQTTNYNEVNANIFITVTPLQSNILVPTSFTQTYGNATFNVNATTNNQETPIQYTSINPLIATVDSFGNITLGNVGNTRVQLFQENTTNYTFFTANTTIFVNQATPTLSIQNFNLVFQSPSFSILPNILTNNPEGPTYTYLSTFPNVANIVSGTLTIGNAGTANIRISQSATTNYLSANANITINVSQLQSTLNYTLPSNITYKDLSFNLRANTNVNGATLLYSAINPLIANVTSTGNVIVGNAGTANINISFLGTNNYSALNANILITVNRLQANLNYPAISSITKNYKDALFALNANTTNTDNTTISYSTNNAIVANVNAFGNITIGNAGTANITLTRAATTNYNSVTANILITVNRLQATLGYPNSSYSKNYLDATFALNANTTNTDNTQILYTTDNAFVATVNTTGNVTIGNVGTANIVLTRDQTTNYNSVTANILITVNPIQANLNYPANSSLTKKYLDATFPLNANTTNKDSSQLLYSTDNSSVAIVDTVGNVVVGNVGIANITLTGNASLNYNSVTANILITVTPIKANLNYPANTNLSKNYLDAPFNLNANTTNTDSTQIIYTTNNSTVAIIDTMGNVTIGNAGTANITLIGNATNNYLSTIANIVIRVAKLQSTITVPASFTTVYGNTDIFNLGATNTNPETAIVYTVINPNIATIFDQTGNVVAGNAGNTRIQLFQPETTNYLTVTANTNIQVDRAIPSLIIDPSFTRYYQDIPFSILPNIVSTNTDPFNTITYSSNNPTIANVVNGIVTIGNAGISNITMIQSQTDNFISVTANTVIYVNKIQPAILVDSSFNKKYGDVSFNVNASTTNTDTSQINYTSDNLNVSTIDALYGNVTVKNVGTANIVLTQPETTNYLPVTATTSINVRSINPTITVAYPITKTYGDSNFNINAYSDNTETPIIYESLTTSVANIDSTGNISILNAGNTMITLNQVKTDNFDPISANTILYVNKQQANIQVNSSFTRIYGDVEPFTLGATNTNPETPIEYTSIDTFVASVDSFGNVIAGNAGTTRIQLFQPETSNYLTVTANTNIQVDRQLSVFTFPSTFTQIYKDASFSILSDIVTNNTDPYATRIVTYQSDNTAVADIVDGIMIIGNAGIANITLSQSQTTNFTDISAVTTITVNRFLTDLTFPAFFTQTYKDASFSILSDIDTNNTDPYNTRIVTYESDNPVVANIIDGTVIIGNAGTANVTLTQPQTTNYTDISAVTTITVNRFASNLTFPATFTRVYRDVSFSILSNIATNNTDPYASRIVTYESDNSIVANIIDGTVIIGNAGTARVTLTQPETTNYTDISAVTTITVNRFASNLTFPPSFTRVYRDASSSILSNIATNNTDPYASRIVTYQSDNAIVANIVDGTLIVGNAGIANIVLSQPQTTNYTDISAITTVTVNKLGANLTFPSTFTRIYNDPSFSILSNIGTNNTDPYTNRAVTYQSDNQIVANIVAGTMIIGNAGVANIVLTQPATTNFTDISASTTITVNKLGASLTFPPTFTKVYLDASFSILSNIATNNTDPYASRIVSYQSNNPIVANIVAGTLIIGNAGTANVVLTQPATSNFTDISAVTTITVNKLGATLEIPSTFTQVYKDASFSILSNIATNNTDPYTSRVVSYQSNNPIVANIVAGTVTIGNAGTASVVLTQPETANYTDISAITTITVNKLTASLTFPPSFTRVYRDASFSILSNIGTNNTDPYATRVVSYQSNNAVVANIVAGNMIIGNAGSANIVLTQPATTNYTDISASTTVTVNRLSASLTVDSSFTRVYQSGTFNIIPNISTTNTDSNRVLQYSTSDATVASVLNGIVTIGNAGNAVITIRQLQTPNYLEVTATTVVYVRPIQANITVSPTFTTTYRNAAFSINATTNNSETPIVYSSSNPIVANVVNGIVTIGNVGNTTITMLQGNTTNYLYTSATSVIYVNRKQPTITVDAVNNKLLRDVSFQLVATTDNSETPIQYTSLNPNIVTVVPGGKVTIGNVGNTVMTLYQPETTNYFSVSANTLIDITNNAYQKVENLNQLQELVNSGKTFYVKTNNDYTNIVVSVINK